MTNNEAAEIMKAIIFMLKNEDYSDEVEEAIHMAIEALKAQESCKIVATNLQPSKQDADDLISRLSEIRSQYNCFDKAERSYYHALSEAIKVLSGRADGDTIRRHDAIRIVDCIDTWQAGWRGNAIESMKALPSAQPEIIRCKDCKYWREGTVYLYCDKLFGMGVLDAYDYMTDEDDYCSMAERKTDEKENI